MTSLEPNAALRILSESIARDAAEYGTRWGYWPGCSQYKVFLGSVPGLDLADPETADLLRQMLKAGLLTFARADLVAAMPGELLARSEWVLDHITQFHFLVLPE